MNDMTLENSVVHQSLEVLGVQAPDNEDLCMYNTGLIDSFEVMQLVLQLEIETGTRLDLVDLMNNGVTITRIRFLLES